MTTSVGHHRRWGDRPVGGREGVVPEHPLGHPQPRLERHDLAAGTPRRHGVGVPRGRPGDRTDDRGQVRPETAQATTAPAPARYSPRPPAARADCRHLRHEGITTTASSGRAMGRVIPRTSARAAATAHRCRITAQRKPQSTRIASDSVYDSCSDTAAGKAAHAATAPSATRLPDALGEQPRHDDGGAEPADQRQRRGHDREAEPGQTHEPAGEQGVQRVEGPGVLGGTPARGVQRQGRGIPCPRRPCGTSCRPTARSCRSSRHWGRSTSRRGPGRRRRTG